jgi:hypothetical protein
MLHILSKWVFVIDFNKFRESGQYDINENKVGFWKEMIPDTLRIDAINYDEIYSTIDVVYTEGDYKNGKK